MTPECGFNNFQGGDESYHLQYYAEVMIARHFIVSGRVQGVGFRWFVLRRARSLNLDGWVRNVPDGTVEVWAEGDEDALNVFEALLKAGPPSAVVKKVRAKSVTAAGRHDGFDVTF